MRKASSSNSDRDKTVHSEISSGDDNVALSNCLVQTPSHNDVIVDIDTEE